MKKVYLSLPISGQDEKERRKYATRVKAMLTWEHKEEEWIVVNPFDIYDAMLHNRLQYGIWTMPSYQEIMEADIRALHECELIALCPGWHLSDGCLEEWIESLKMGIDHIFL